MSANMRAPCPPDALFREVEDLSRYPGWLTIVTRAEPARDEDQETRPVWFVELRGRIGPLARSKRLRMVRTVHEPGRRARFERLEVDGREHSPWVLDARVEPAGSDESSLEMSLHYGGSFGGSILERLLADEIEASRPRLADRVRGRTHPGFGVTDHR